MKERFDQSAISSPEKSKAGAVIFRKTESGTDILLVHRTKQNDWSFPKGHVEPGEELSETALREIHEETGLRPVLIKRINDLIYEDSNGQPVKLAMFLGMDNGINKLHSTSKEQAAWISLGEVESTLSYENLRHYWKQSVQQLIK